MDKSDEVKVIYRMVRKNISIPKDQDIWLTKNHISLSRLVQDMIREAMKRKR